MNETEHRRAFDGVMRAVAELQRRHLAGEALRCMGCNRLRRWSAGALLVGGFMPANPAYPGMAYCACRACIESDKRRARLFRWIETRSRAEAEGRAP